MSRREDPLRRGRVIRRRKDEPSTEPEALPTADVAPATPSPDAASAAPRAAGAPPSSAAPGRAWRRAEAPAPAAPAPAPAPARRGPTVDKDALLAELQDLSAADMAALMGAAGGLRQPRPGDRVEGAIVRVAGDAVFVDIGGKSEAMLDRTELAAGATPRVGDRISGFIASADHDGVRITKTPSGAGAWEALLQAYEAGTPVEGRIQDANPGGVSVRIGAIRAFCPISQLSRLPVEDAARWVGRTLAFEVLEIREDDVVVSHRRIEEAAVAEQAAGTWTTLGEGDAVDGVVTAVKDFGVFVEVAGVQGLIPRSELGWGHRPEAPKVGARISARVMAVDRDARRLTLSMKDPGSSPWSRVGVDLVEGGRYDAKVVRLTDFGVFLSLAPGLEGLAHISRLSDKRVGHPSEVVTVGDTVQATIVEIDLERERIALSLRSGDAVAAPREERAPRKATSGDASLGTLGDLLSGLKLPKK